MNIPFNKPYLAGNELNYIKDAVSKGKISGGGHYTLKCQEFFRERYGFKKCLLTTSCTDALEMAAILCDIHPGDEVIVPSFTFVSTANAFVLRGAKIVFVDSRDDHPGMDEDRVEELITDSTKVIVAVHYSGIACDMDKLMNIAGRHNLFVVEDAAQSIDSYYKGIPLGSIGHFGCFSFHETKNVQCGEGGMLVINDENFFNRAEIIWEKGTNRSAFWRGEIDKYTWVDIGSSFLPSEVTAAFLYAQLECLDLIQKRRKIIWQKYYDSLKLLAEKGYIKIPSIPDYATNNGHLFNLECRNLSERKEIIEFLGQKNIQAVFHYISLHTSVYYQNKKTVVDKLPNAEKYTDTVIRLPLYYKLSEKDQDHIISEINNFYI
jgi:dTDP-4-amino-4,6-dideoxygalactose transaminase